MESKDYKILFINVYMPYELDDTSYNEFPTTDQLNSNWRDVQR